MSAFPRRWPWLTFAVMPVVSFVVIGVAFMAVLLGLSEMGLGTRTSVQTLFFALRAVLIWGVPISFSAFFASLAYRRHVPLGWALLATVIVCSLAAMINVDLIMNAPGSEPGGQLTMGFGTSLQALPRQAARALVTALVVIVPLLLASKKKPRLRT